MQIRGPAYVRAGLCCAIFLAVTSVEVVQLTVGKAGQIPLRPWSNPFGSRSWNELSDSQREAVIAATYRRSEQFLRDFVAQRLDPHSLPVIKFETYAGPEPSRAAALQAAQLIVLGMVTDVSFSPGPNGALPSSVATVAVRQTVKGSSPSTLKVLQSGGPVAQGNNGALAEFETDELILPGDDVILLLKRDSPSEPYRTLLGAGVFFIRGGAVHPEASNAFGEGLKGASVSQVLAFLKD